MKKKLIAITGGLATGKSTVLSIISEMNFPTISCDEIVKDLYARPDIRHYLRELCGEGILNEKGEVDRRKLLSVILSDEGLKKRLEEFIHPLVWKEIQRFSSEKWKTSSGPVFVEVPLLFEAGWEDKFDEIWVVTCSEETQKERLLKKPEADLWLLLAKTQIPLEEKARRADRVISSEKPISELKEELRGILREYQVA